GLVGLRAVPAATGSIDGDIAALGALLEVCLTGLDPAEAEPPPLHGPPPLAGPSAPVPLGRRARSTEPGQGLSSVAAMASLLAERPRTGPSASPTHTAHPPHRTDDSASAWPRPPPPRSAPPPPPRRDAPASGWLPRPRERRTDPPDVAAEAGPPVRLDRH